MDADFVGSGRYEGWGWRFRSRWPCHRSFLSNDDRLLLRLRPAPLQISADLLVASIVSINTLGLQYDFTVFRSPSAFSNGIDHLASSYATTPITSSIRFGFPNSVVTAGTFRAATNINPGSLPVSRLSARMRMGRPRSRSLEWPVAPQARLWSSPVTMPPWRRSAVRR